MPFRLLPGPGFTIRGMSAAIGEGAMTQDEGARFYISQGSEDLWHQSSFVVFSIYQISG